MLLHEGLGKCRQVRLGKRTETVKDRIGGFTGKCEGRMYFWPSGMLCRSLGRSFLKKSVSGQSRLLDLQREVSEILQQKLLKNLSCLGYGKVLTEQSSCSNDKKRRLEINKPKEVPVICTDCRLMIWKTGEW